MRTFIAVDLAERLKSKVVDIQNRIGTKHMQIKFVEPENLHFTLKFLGEIEEHRLDEIHERVKTNLKNYDPFEITLRGLGAFPSFSYIKVVWIGVREGNELMTEIANILNRDLQSLGFKKEKDYVPHLTIARVKGAKNKEKFIEILKELKNVEVGTMPVEIVTIKKSDLTPQGPIYSDLKEVRL